MGNINVLDCTLREGGYVNDWNFGKENIKKIIQALYLCGIDFVECGFYKIQKFSQDKSIFNSLEKFCDIVPNDLKFTLMINFGEVPIDFIPKCENKNLYFRVAFRQNDYIQALDYCRSLKDKGYKIFVNSMSVNSYSKNELYELIERVNDLSPYAYTLSDTLGCMQKNDIINAFEVADKNLSDNIKLAFHSHNNMQLAFSNSQLFLEQGINRDIIIDSTLMGIGRGAGNLSTEMITKFLNFMYGKNYNLEYLLNIIEEQIQPIFSKKQWGYSVPYYISALNSCHPNYAKYMYEELHLNIQQIYDIMQLIPKENKLLYDKNIVERLCKNNLGV